MKVVYKMDENFDRVIFCRDTYYLPSIDDIIVSFKLNDTTVYTKDDLLIVEYIKMIDSIDSASEIKRYTRPDLLVIQGILSYFTGYLFTIYEFKKSEIQTVKSKVSPAKNIMTTTLLSECSDH